MPSSGVPAETSIVVPRDAATVVVVRDRPGGLEIFCVERHKKSGFMGGALVFPGGKVDDSDHDDVWRAATTGLRERARAFAEDERTARAYAVAALREALEEAAILPVAGGPLDAGRVETLRREMASTHDGEGAPLARALEEGGYKLDTLELEGIARWITPLGEPRRYDTRFYLMRLPEAQVGAHDEHETTSSFWATPEDILARWERGEVFLAPPTSWTIDLFSRVGSVSEAFAAAREQPLDPIEPIFIMERDESLLVMPGDPLHPSGPRPKFRGATRFVVRDGRLVPQTT